MKIKIGKNQSEEVAKRWWNLPKNHIWILWLSKYPNVKISEIVFIKLLRKECPHIKTCRRATDMCGICLQAEKDTKLLNNKLEGIHSSCVKQQDGCLHDDCVVNKCAKESREQTNEVKQLRLNLQIAKEHQQIQSTSKTTIQNAKEELEAT